jgi:hypothetical protein
MMKRVEYEQTTHDLLRRQPFRPFVIEYDDGRRFVVDDPRRLFGPEVFIRPDGEWDMLDHEEVLRVAELTEAAAS